MHSAEEAEPLDLYKGSGKLYKKAERKYGKENFLKEIISYHSSREELKIAEKALITLDIVKDPNYYNLKTGGEGGSDGLSQRSKDKISKANKGRLVGDKNPRWGKTLSAESIARGKEKHRRYGKPALHGLKINVDGKYYESCREAAKDLGISSATIQKRVKSPKYLNYRYQDESKNAHKSQKFVKINENYYESLRIAEKKTGIPRKRIADNIKNSIEGYCYETITSLRGRR